MTYTVSGLTEGATYYFAVEAFNACNQSSAFTNEASITTATAGGNIAPTAKAGTDQLHPETTSGIPTTIALNGSNATDSDGIITAYPWGRVDSHFDITAVTSSGSESSDPGGTIRRTDSSAETPLSIQHAGTAAPTFEAPAVTADTPFELELTVTDSKGQTARDTVRLTLTDLNPPPMADAGPNQTVNEQAVVSLFATNSSDLDGTIAFWLWGQVIGPQDPVVSLSGAATKTGTFTAPNVNADGASLTFRLTITDSERLSATDQVIVNVLHSDKPPVANAGSTFSAEEKTTVTLSGAESTDPDDGISSWSWTQTAGSPVTLATPEESMTHFVAPQASPGGIDLAFTLTVTDNGGLSHSDASIVRMIYVQTAPTADTSNASIEILNSPLELQAWLSIGWDAYRKNSNEARVASGDLNGHGTVELVIGLGPVENDSAMPGGLFQIMSNRENFIAIGLGPYTPGSDTGTGEKPEDPAVTISADCFSKKGIGFIGVFYFRVPEKDNHRHLDSIVSPFNVSKTT